MPQICGLLVLHRAGLCTTVWLSGLYFSLIRLELCHRCALLHKAGLCTTVWLFGLYFGWIRLELCYRYVYYHTVLDSVLLYGCLVYISV